ncbi:hypothetical protein M0805_007785 [Coniferiporia weirii]|nr:hypothetical protein M0805_007785 [Coniferiporia weirii]
MHVELLQLKTLELRTELMDETYTTGSILKAISAPNVSKLIVRIDSYMLDELEMQLEDLFPKDNLRWPRLESLDFELELEENGYVSGETLDVVFTRLPKIQHLRISCEGIEHPSTLNVHKRERQQSPYPPLLLKDIIKAPEFASLKIDECPLIEKGIVRELMPDDKVLEWKLSAKGANELRLRLERIKEERNG